MPGLSLPTDDSTVEPITALESDAVRLFTERARKVAPKRPRPRQATVGQSVTRKVDSSGNISFAGTNYRVGRAHIRRQVQVAIVGDSVEISAGGEILKVHPIRHDRSREHGAFANAGGRPSRTNAA